MNQQRIASVLGFIYSRTQADVIHQSIGCSSCCDVAIQRKAHAFAGILR